MEKFTSEDIKRLKEDLSHLEQYIQEFVAFLPLAVCTINLIGKVIGTNKAFEQLSGFYSAQIVGKYIDNFFVEKKEIEKMKKEITKKQTIENKQFTLMAKGNKKIPVNASMGSRQNEKGNFLGFFMAISDITELKKLQLSLEKKVEERTKELKKRVEELEKIQKITVGRELKMVELKKQIRKLENSKEI